MAASAAPQVGVPTWQLDPAHSAVEFSVKHMMMTTVRGRFKSVHATLRGDRDHPEQAGVDARIEVGSIDTGVADRDAHLRGPDFFDAENHPEITFDSDLIVGSAPKQEGDRFQIVGALVIRDTNMDITLDCEYLGSRRDRPDRARRAH